MANQFTSPAYSLIPASIAANIPKLGETRSDPDPTIHVKLFTPDANFTWYVVERSPDTDVCFGFVVGPFSEWGSFDLQEIREIRGSLNLPVERDLHFDPCPSSKITRDY